MGRLIDADAFERSVMFGDAEDMQDVICALREYPTAYDVDTVAKQLEEEKNLHKRMIKYEQKNGTVTEEFQARRAVEVLERAIEIVKGGGVE